MRPHQSRSLTGAEVRGPAWAPTAEVLLPARSSEAMLREFGALYVDLRASDYSNYFVQPGTKVLLHRSEPRPESEGAGGQEEAHVPYHEYRVGEEAPLGTRLALHLPGGNGGVAANVSSGVELLVADMPRLGQHYTHAPAGFDKQLAASLRGAWARGRSPDSVLRRLHHHVLAAMETLSTSQERQAVVLNTLARTLGEPQRLAWLLRHVDADQIDKIVDEADPQWYCLFFAFPLSIGGLSFELHVHQSTRQGRSSCNDNLLHDHRGGAFASYVSLGEVFQTTYRAGQGTPPGGGELYDSSKLLTIESECDPPEAKYLRVNEENVEPCALCRFASFEDYERRCVEDTHRWRDPGGRSPEPFFLEGAPCVSHGKGESYFFPPYWIHRTHLGPSYRRERPAVSLTVWTGKDPFYRLIETPSPDPPVPKARGDRAARYNATLQRVAAYLTEREPRRPLIIDDLLY